MNKKLYFAPEMEVTIISTEGFLAASEWDDENDNPEIVPNPGSAGDDDVM